VRRLLTLVSFLVVVSAAGASPRSTGLISFWSDRSGNPGVWLMEADGSDQRLLTGNTWTKRGSFSPDGSLLVLDGPVDVKARTGAANFDLYLANTDGSGLRKLTTGPDRDVLASWSPDGRWIAFSRLARARGSVEHVWLVRPDGTHLRRLRAGAGGAWSPDGRRLAFGEQRGTHYVVSVMGADGCCLRRLTGTGADAAPGDWSPDGRLILFTRWETNRAGEVWVMNPNGREQRRLTRNPADDFDPTWSPDGTRILFTSTRTGSKDVWVMNADGSHPVRLTTASSDDWATDWQP
jgi:TolB protein